MLGPICYNPLRNTTTRLKPHESMPIPPLIRTFPNGEEILRFNFRNIKPWEYTAEEIRQEGLPGLLLFLPLTKDGAKRDTIEAMVTELIAANKQDILYLGYMVAALVLEKEADLQWLKERFVMLEDILSETWVYQDVFQKGEAKGEQEGKEKGQREGELLASRQAIITVTQARFVELVSLISKNIANVTDLGVLQNLLIKISVSRNVQEATQALFETIPNTENY